MDTKGPLNPTAEGHQNIFVIVDHYNATIPAPKMLILPFMLPNLGLNLHRGSGNKTTEMSNLRNLFNTRHSSRTLHCPWTNGFC